MFQNHKINQRQIWANTRAIIESENYKIKASGEKSKSRWPLFARILRLFKPLFKISGLYKKGYKNTMSFGLNEYNLNFENLPKSFYGFKVLFLSDLHLDTTKGFENKIIEKIKGIKCDLCLFGGDYRVGTSGSVKHIKIALNKIADNINSKYGIYAVLGNHDTYMLTEDEESLNFRFLINESVSISKNDEEIIISGTDDPFKFYTDNALATLEKSGNGFKIALVHTSELSMAASENNYSFYLCGHTHGGQICLPGGKALITHQKEGKDFVKGFWKRGEMIGYTSTGVGVSGLPVRFNCPGEIAMFNLKF